MGVLKRKRPKTPTDVQLDDGPVPGWDILEHMCAKRYCTIDAGLDPGLMCKALSEVDQLDSHESRFIRPSPIIQSGLLGRDGSALIAMITEAPQPLPAELALEETPSPPSALATLDSLMSEVVWPPDAAWGDAIGLSKRSPGLLHLSGYAVVDEPTLTDQQIEEWLDSFKEQRLVSCVFLGPSAGVLEFTPLKDKGADPLEVLVEPGMLVLWLPQHFQPEFRVSGRSVALTSFFGLSGRLTHAKHGPAIPVVQQLLEMQLHRLRELKVLQETGEAPPVLGGWATRLKHEVFAGQAIAVRGAAGHFPAYWDVEKWSAMMLGGPDFATEVPPSRWQHDEYYDPDPDSWQRRKIFTKHGSFIDGVDLFDHRAFSISEAEATVMDPNQRHVLEVAYEALLSAGHQRNLLFGRTCGTYVGHAMPEWALARQQDCGRFGHTGMMPPIASNRISYTLGTRGPSMTIDTEQASSLTAVYMASESVLNKGRAEACEMSVACGVSLMLSPAWWIQCCADGWFSWKGRARCFDAGADGYIRADASAGLVVTQLKGQTPGICMIEDDDPDTCLGMIAGAMLNNSGKNARLNMPDAVSEQGVLIDVLVAAALAAEDIDSVEAVAPAIPLHDAVEASAINRAYAGRHREEPLYITSGKSASGHSLDCSGVQLFIKNIRSIYHTSIHPQLHLAVLNPYVAYQVSDEVHIASESLLYRMESAFFACKARGFGGVNVAIIGWNRSW